MTERPILFKGRLVRRILAGGKTQTRRLVKLRQFMRTDTPGYDWIFRDRRSLWNDYTTAGLTTSKHNPHGAPGDRLWVRETFWQAVRYPGTMPSGEAEDHASCRGSLVHFAADGEPANTPNRHYPRGLSGGSFSAPDPYAIWEQRPSIHMPRAFSRIDLDITGVRVERLQDISEEDAIAEGVTSAIIPADDYGPQRIGYCAEDDGKCVLLPTARAVFAELWKSINGPESWDANPWVWVVEFKRAAP